MSRTTLHRIERGEPSVTMGAYLNAIGALGLELRVVQPTDETSVGSSRASGPSGWIPARIRMADYPQLARIAWQVHGTDELSPAEAVGIYERNGRHLDPATLEARERDLIDALRLAFGERGTTGV